MQLKRKDRLYYARIIPKTKIYEVCEVIVRTVRNTWFTAIDKRDKRVYFFNYKSVGHVVFFDRNIALSKVLETEKRDDSAVRSEIYYEEY